MISKRDLIYCYNNTAVGQDVTCIRPTDNVLVQARVIEKYPNFIRVQHGKIKWCVKWSDVILMMR